MKLRQPNLIKSLAISALLALFVCATAKAADAFEQNKKLGRGVNILGYDPIWRDRSQARFKADYFRKLHEAGFTSVRINLHAFRHMTNDSALRPEWFQVADWAVTNSLANNLAPILDMHEYNAMGENPEANKAKFLGF